MRRLFSVSSLTRINRSFEFWVLGFELRWKNCLKFVISDFTIFSARKNTKIIIKILILSRVVYATLGINGAIAYNSISIMKITRRQAIFVFLAGAISICGINLNKLFGNKKKRHVKLPVHSKHTLHAKVSNRIISVYSSGVSQWNGKSYPYVDTINYSSVKKMLNLGLQELTSQKDIREAWRMLFFSYRHGDIIAIKPNFNDLYNEFKENLVVSPAVINAIISGLVDNLGVPEKNIIIYDCTRKIPNAFRDRICYPIRYVEAWASSLVRKFQYKLYGNSLAKADERYKIKMSNDIKNKQGNSVTCYLPKVIDKAQHIINVPIFKSHQFVLASGALKNHYGTVRFSDGITSPLYLHPPIIEQSIVDVNSHPQIREKTRLIVMDALFGRLKKKGGPPDKWNIFNNTNPNRLFLGLDPVAIDTVTSNLIKEELTIRNEKYFSDKYLQIAANSGLGLFEVPVKGRYKKIDFRTLTV